MRPMGPAWASIGILGSYDGARNVQVPFRPLEEAGVGFAFGIAVNYN
jgi:hypothetical protein